MTYMLKKLNLAEKNGKIGSLHGKLIKTRLHYGETFDPVEITGMLLLAASLLLLAWFNARHAAPARPVE